MSKAEAMPVETRLRHYTSSSTPQKSRTSFFTLFGDKDLIFKVTPAQRRRLTHKWGKWPVRGGAEA